MFTVPSNFIGVFKTGDNINHNLRILKLLYAYFDEANDTEKELLRKPITVTLVSITEAMLHDFHTRVQRFTTEGVSNLADSVRQYIRGNRLEAFERYIASARKHDLFKAEPLLYDHLDELRRLRNRVHIQNSKRDYEPDESVAFSDERKIRAEKVLEYVCKFLSRNHARPRHFAYVADFQFPWQPHDPRYQKAPPDVTAVIVE